MRIFIHCNKIFFHYRETYFPHFHWSPAGLLSFSIQINKYNMMKSSSFNYNWIIQKWQDVYNKQKFFSINTDLFSSCGMKIIISPFVKYLFSHHSMKINGVFIEKKLEYPLYIAPINILSVYCLKALKPYSIMK